MTITLEEYRAREARLAAEKADGNSDPEEIRTHSFYGLGVYHAVRGVKIA